MTMKNELKSRPHVAFAGDPDNHFGPRFHFDGDEAAEAERLRAAAEKATADKAAADKAAADKAAADKAAADKAAADKIAAEKAEADRLALSKLTDKEAELLKEQMKTKEKLKAANEAREALEAKLKLFEGLDPTKAKELVEAQNKAALDKIEADKKALEKAGEFDRLKTMMADEHKKDLTAAQEQIRTNATALDTALKTINDLTVGASFNTSKFIADEMVLPARVAREVYGANFEIENGQVVAYDKPKGADGRTKLVNSSGEPVSFEEAIQKLVDAAPDKDQLLKSKLKTGASSTTTGAPVRPGSPSSQVSGEVTGRSRIEAALAKGAFKKAAK